MSTTVHQHQEHALHSPFLSVLVNRGPELERCRTFIDGSFLEIQTLVDHIGHILWLDTL